MAHDRVEAVERALKLLDSFNQHERVLTLAALAEKTGFYKSTILRLIRSLERFGYILRLDDGRYSLGPAVGRLGSVYQQDFDLGSTVRPILARIRDTLEETASFYMLEGSMRVCAYRENSKRAIRHHLDEGIRLPVDVGAAGKILTAAETAQPEFALSLGERDPEVAAVAVPVMGRGDALMGALTVSGLIHHFDDGFQSRCIELLRHEAAQLENELQARGG